MALQHGAQTDSFTEGNDNSSGEGRPRREVGEIADASGLERVRIEQELRIGDTVPNVQRKSGIEV